MAASLESDICFECGGDFLNDNYKHCAGCSCRFHIECLRKFDDDFVCTQCLELMSKESPEANKTPVNENYPNNQEKLIRAPARKQPAKKQLESFGNDLALFKLHLIEEEQLLAEKRQKEKEKRLREINSYKDKQIRQLQELREAELIRKERENAECVSRLEMLELDFQQQQEKQDAEFIRRKSMLMEYSGDDPISNEMLSPEIPRNEGNVAIGLDAGVQATKNVDVNVNRQCQESPAAITTPFPIRQFQNLAENSFRNARTLNSFHLSSRKGLNNSLPKFSGNPREWPFFIKRFESTTSSCNFDNVENLSRLNDALEGSARSAVSGLLLHEHHVPTIIKRLQTFFGQSKYIINDLEEEIRNEKVLRMDNLRAILKFSNKVSNLVATLQTAEASNRLWSPYLINEIVEKLPLQLQREWSHHKQSYEEVNLEIFSMWLDSEAEMITNISTKSLLYDEKESFIKKSFVNFHHDQSSNAKGCYMCNGTCSDLSQCSDFKDLGYNKRMELVSKKFLCRSCLKRCKKKCTKQLCGINNCTFYHHALLHKDNQIEEAVHTSSVNVHQSQYFKTWFKILPVMLWKGNKSVKILALLDSAASISLIDEELSNQLGLEGTPQPLCIKWTDGSHRTMNDSIRVFLEVSNTENPLSRYKLNDVRTVSKLDLPFQSLSKKDFENYHHMIGIPFVPYEKDRPKILIGLDNARLMSVKRRRIGGINDPIAEKTDLGWVISGGKSDDSGYIYSVQQCSESDDKLEELLKNFIIMDTLGTCPLKEPLLSKEDNRALSLIKKGTRQVGKRFEVPLLWKFDVFTCPNNYNMAIRRLYCLEKKMQKEPKIAEALNEMINDYLAKGYVKQINSQKDPALERCWYLPIFVVRNHNKPSKLRIVWDAAAQYQNIALNTLMLKGPDMTANILNVLFRFQEKCIAITGDIKEMYHQVAVNSNDRKYLRFLYRENSKESLKVYEMQVLVFGAACSGFCAQYIMQKNADKFGDLYPQAVESIKLSHYVDDLLDSVDTEEEAVVLASRIREIHAEGGFEIRNWLSNSSKVMKALHQESQPSKPISLEESCSEKVLGMWWKPQTDVFTFSLKYNTTTESVIKGVCIPTKRQMLRLIMSVYDPLGLLNHFMTVSKILMQDVWRSKINWDDKITGEQHLQWREWLSVLPEIEFLAIPRSYFTSPVNEVELHVFVDASEEAYAACVYFRAVVKDSIEVRLVTSKSRVAPLRSTSVPRLELQSALLGARLSSAVSKSHRFKVVRFVYWSDSRTVLAWIKSDHRKFHQYVACRVGEILELTNMRDWRWIPTNMNVSDKATRKTVPEISSNDSWFKGPSFLYLEENLWPSNIPLEDSNVTEDLRSRYVHQVNFHHTCMEIDRFSNWSRLLRSQAYVLRFVNNLKAKLQKTEGKFNLFSKDEYVNAERTLIVQSQMEAFEEEYVSLVRGTKISKSSCLYKYSPFIDDRGLIRCSSRLDVDTLPECFRRPVILPSRHKVTLLILNNFHKMYLHRNFETVVNEVNQRFIVPKLRSALKNVRRMCQKCKVLDAKVEPPKMSALPPERLQPFFRPFAFTGIDFFGPLTVVVGRHHEKRWGIIMTCLNTRAIHIEVAFSLSTDSCIMGIKRFINRRGIPQKIFSDNGTNLKGASKELRDAMEKIEQNKLAENFISTVTEWSFIPPSAPHMGGAWERLVRSVKSAISFAFPKKVPTDELLWSMMSEAENIINSRPLTFIPLDSESAEALSPNHFLLGSSSGIKPLIDSSCDEVYLRKSWHRLEVFGKRCWQKWLKTYIPTLICREKWNEEAPNLKTGDLVFILDDNAPKNEYKRGRIVETVASRDGRVRKATVQVSGKFYSRPATKLAKIDVIMDDGKAADALPGGAVGESDNSNCE